MIRYKTGDVLEVSFPFVDRPVKKRRPAFLLSNQVSGEGDEILIFAMITSAKRSHWEHDVILDDWEEAGLRGPSVLRWKIFSLDASLVLGRRGSVSKRDVQQISKTFQRIFSLFCITMQEK